MRSGMSNKTKNIKDKKIKWEVLEECNDEYSGEPSCWCAEINHWYHGKFCWISYFGESEGYAVEVKGFDGFIELVRCKSFSSAKRWVTMHLL